jgi:hypothetical protein
MSIMKKKYPFVKRMAMVAIIAAFQWPVLSVMAQDEPADDGGMKPVKGTFESSWIIENQTVMVPSKGTLEFMIQHRFGTIENGVKDLWGLYADAGTNIRLGLSYTLFDNFGFGYLKGPLSVGIGSTRNNRIQDVNVKYAFLRQTRNNKIPVSVTYFSNVAIETKKPTEQLPNGNEEDRFSYFHQLIISRKFSPELSVQVAPSVSHYNVMASEMSNDHFAVALAARYKFSPQSSLMVNVDQPLTTHKLYNPQPNVSFGIEIATSAHAFQLFFTNYGAIAPQRNNVFNQNDPWNKGWLIGFNITRLWSF